ncbi:T9SS type A sorting domain-containing protein [Flavobacterium sp. D11R37]|uniref:T9SS type A sorting domain-containing protein n=1 Tax=Flavobacterium coralii TaxID=2838017 RepID=UPI001CA74428|nr:T9SS type A sorting domain-containing protein [Flavobacterium coralii]MBY8962490.1 T9SS type A sorting domain-containing protein [Flavobacterium coralii]
MKKIFTLILIIISTSNIKSQTEYTNTNFGDNGYMCFPYVHAVGDMMLIDNSYYGLTSYSSHSLFKFDQNGQIDTSFGQDGYRYTGLFALGGTADDFTNAFIRLTPDNKLITIADPTNDPEGAFMAMFDINGNVETTFGTDGLVYTIFDEVLDLHTVELINNEIILIGNGNNSEDYSPYIKIFKYTMQGELITTLGDNGIITIPMEQGYEIKHIEYDNSNNAMYVLIWYNQFTDSKILKYNTVTGEQDMDFGSAGELLLPEQHRIYTFLATEDGEIFTASTFSANGTENNNLSVTKYNNQQLPDLSFGNDGTFVSDMGMQTTVKEVFDIQFSGNSLLLSGNLYPGSEQIFLTKTSIDGFIDSNFGNNGSIAYTHPDSYNTTFTYKTIEHNNTLTIATASHQCPNQGYQGGAIVQMSATILSEQQHDTGVFSMYPNPVKDILNFSTSNAITKVELYDVSGKMLLAEKNPSSGLNLSGFTAGLYIIKTYTKYGVDTYKIIKE